MNPLTALDSLISILYVDDEPDLQVLTRLFLERTGRFRVDTALSAREALEKLSTGAYDAIVSDYHMPGMSGIDLLKYVREHYGSIPFILFTGRGREEVVIQALENGADFYIQKGGEPRSQFVELQNKIEKAVLEKQAVLARKESEHRLSGIIDFLPDATFAIDRTGTVIVWNKAIEEMTGVAAADMLGRSDYEYALPFYGIRRKILIDLVFESDKEIEDKYASIVRKEGHIIFAETPAARPLGQNMWLWAKASPLYDQDGAAIGAIESIRDISDRKRAEEILVENRDYLDQIFSSVKEGILIIDAETHEIVDLNPAATTLIGAGREEILGRICHQFVCPAQAGCCPITNLHQTIDNSERILLTADGRKTPIIKYVVPFQLQGKKCLLETFYDNSQRVKDLEALRQSEEKFRSFVENANDIVYALLPTGVFTYISPNLTDILGYRKEEVIGQHFKRFIHPEDFPRCLELLGQVLTTGEKQAGVEFRVLHKNGTWKWHISNHSPIHDSRGAVNSIIGISRDVTWQKQNADALMRANRQLTLLSSITRHDILNKITVILSYLVLIEERTTDPAMVKCFKRIEAATQTIRSQIEFTRVYEDLGTHEPQWQSLDDILSRIQVPDQIILHTSTSGVSILADPMLEKVFFTLLDNSVTHGIQVSSISVKTLPSREELLIVWGDNGIGIADEAKTLIFERGYGTNTGFGLFLSRDILAITGITISENGKPGEGAQFVITVPRGMWRSVPADTPDP